MKLSSDLDHYLRESVLPGLGLFGESYLLFSLGTLKPLWTILYPDCFNGDVCSSTLLHSLSYSVVAGVMIGMVILGTAANKIGRRIGSIITASLMMLGALAMALISFFMSDYPSTLFLSMSLALFLFGIGVGGEYPLSASSASERAMNDLKTRMEQEETKMDAAAVMTQGFESFPTVNHKQQQQEFNRGKRVQLVFTMQGMGIFVNSLLLVLLLSLTGQMDQQNVYDYTALLNIWRAIYALGALILAYVLVFRVRHLEESQTWKRDKELREQIKMRESFVPPTNDTNITHDHAVEHKFTSKDLMEVRLLLTHFGYRLFGTCTSWFLWDVAFYGNKLFQSSFILALIGENTTLLNVAGGT